MNYGVYTSPNLLQKVDCPPESARSPSPAAPAPAIAPASAVSPSLNPLQRGQNRALDIRFGWIAGMILWMLAAVAAKERRSPCFNPSDRQTGEGCRLMCHFATITEMRSPLHPLADSSIGLS